MQDIVEDIIKIYLASIAGYNSKIYQTINDKYTVIDRSMLTAYLYLKIVEDKNEINQDSTEALSNYLIKQIIYSETGNISFELPDKSKEALYHELLDNLILEKFEYKNRILKKLKYDYTIIESNQYISLLSFLEDVVEYAILKKMITRGNKEAIAVCNNIKNKIINRTNTADNTDDFLQEKLQLTNLISQNRLDDSIYGNILYIGFNLKEVYRYSAFMQIIPENVLFHHYTVTIISLLIAKYCTNVLKEHFDIYTILSKSLIHDFTEYTGIEIVGQFKYYNEITKKMFAEIEENEENQLREMIGENLYKILSQCKSGAEGFLFDLVDKILGITKNWIEVGFFNNNTMIKATSAIYQNRFKKFLRIKTLEEIKNKNFFMDLLRESYIYIMEHLIEKDLNYSLIYYTEEELTNFRKEIQNLKNHPESFLM